MGIDVNLQGDYYAIWADYRNPGNPHIRFAFRPADGAWNASEQIDDTAAGDQVNPSFEVDGQGNAYAVWEDERKAPLMPRSTLHTAPQAAIGKLPLP